MDIDRIRPPSVLLLLPPAPSASFEQLQQAYRPPISGVFAKLARSIKKTNLLAPMDIAICIPGLLSPSCRPRTRLFAPLQRLLADVYKLIGIASIEQDVELDVPGGIDACVFFLDFDPVPGLESSQQKPPTSQLGPIIDLQTLAKCGRPRDLIFYPDNASGRKLIMAFNDFYSSFRGSSAGISQLIPGGLEKTQPGPILVPENGKNSTACYSTIVGGTFDHIHLGHKLLLTATVLPLEPFSEAESGRERLLTVGITGDQLLVNKKYAEFLESWEERHQRTGVFLSSIIDFRPPGKSATKLQQMSLPEPNGKYFLMEMGPGLVFKFVEISDPFGPTISEEKIDVLVISKETRSGGAAVNDERAKKGWKSLDVFEIDVLETGDVPASETDNFASKLSSTEIRRRRMDMAKK